MNHDPAPKSTRANELDPRDLARRIVALATATSGIVGILCGRPLFAVLERAGAVCVAGMLSVLAGEAIVRRARRRIVR